MLRYHTISYNYVILDKLIRRSQNTVHVKTLFKNHALESTETKQNEVNNIACCLPYLPQCPPPIPDCEPCPPCCPPNNPPPSNDGFKKLLVQALKVIILGASIFWTYSEGVWSHPDITDNTFRRWYGQVFGSPVPEACICDDKKHIPTHEEISFRVTQTYYGLTSGIFKGLASIFGSKKGKKELRETEEELRDCQETALCPKL